MKNRILRSVFFFCSAIFLLMSSPSHANPEDQASLENGQQLESNDSLNLNDVNGLIIDRTMTGIGSNFYTEFSKYMNESQPDLNENFTVKERATASQGSIITVWHSQKVVYRTTLSPGARQAREKAQAAVATVSNYLLRWKIERLYSDTFDLDHDELQ